MPSSAATSASIAGRPSRSAIVWGDVTVSGYHVLDIEGYSSTKALPTGQCITSRSFSVGETSWRISYYPNGDISSTDKYISVFLHLEQQSLLSSNPAVKAVARFSLLDRAGKPVPSHARDSGGTHEFSAEHWGFSDFIERAWLEQSAFLKDDCFTIMCELLVFKEINRTEERRVASPPPSSPWVVVPPSTLQRNLGDLLAARESTDVTFEVAGEVFEAHRCVLAARSPVFKAELFSAMRERADTTVIHVYDMEAKVFGDLLRFVYTDTVPDVPDMKLQDEVAMAQHLLVAADRYNLERLKLICEDKLCKLMDISSVATILTLAEQHNCRGLKMACLQFLRSPWTLNAVMKTDGFEHLERSCPSVFKELFSVAVGMHIYREEAKRTVYWRQLIVLVVLCIVLYLKGGNVILSCFCFLFAAIVVATKD